MGYIQILDDIKNDDIELQLNILKKDQRILSFISLGTINFVLIFK